MDRKKLLALMPRNKSDSAAANAVTKLGYPMVKPILKDMLLWLRVSNSEVADLFCDFFVKLGPAGLDVVAGSIGLENPWLRNRILVEILPGWPPVAIHSLKDKLTILTTHPDALDNDLHCAKLLLNHQIVDTAWLQEWLKFKRERVTERLNFLEALEAQLQRDK